MRGGRSDINLIVMEFIMQSYSLGANLLSSGTLRVDWLVEIDRERERESEYMIMDFNE